MLVPGSTAREGHTHDSSAPLFAAGSARIFALITGLFFLWGIPNNLNDVLIRQFMTSFAISRFQAGLVQSAFYLGYFLLALPAGFLMKRVGYKTGFVTGLLLFASGCFLFWPAALVRRYGFFLMALFIMASGLSFLETASNPFIAQLGAPQSSERRLNFSQAFNPVGAITGVLIGTFFIFSGIELSPAQVLAKKAAGTYAAYLQHETLRVVAPYMALGVLALLWAVMIGASRLPAVIDREDQASSHRGSWRELLAHRQFLFAVLAQFMYIGAQVGTWSYFIQYVQDNTHLPERSAGLMLTLTLMAFGAGRFSSAQIMRWIEPGRLMAWYAAANICLLLLGIFVQGWTGVVSVLLTSFFMSIMFPTIFALGLKGLGPNTKIGGALLVMAIVGGAVWTPLMGLTAGHFHSTAEAYQFPLYGYVIVALFALSSVRRRSS